MSLTEAQFDLVNRACAPWLTLWLLADYDAARSHAVGAGAGGTYRTGEHCGTYRTDDAGMSATHDAGTVRATWAEVRRWCSEQASASTTTAARLLAEGREYQAAYPSSYPSIGRAYAWDTTPPGSPEQHEQDRADLAAAHARRELEVDAWHEVQRVHNKAVREFLASLRPVDELDLFGGVA